MKCKPNLQGWVLKQTEINSKVGDRLNLFELFVKIGVDDQASGKLKDIGSKLGNGLKTAAKIGTAAVGAAATGIVALTKASIDQYAEYEQLVGGVETLFKDSANTLMSYASDAYKAQGISANEYMSLATSFSASLLQSLEGDTDRAVEATNLAITDMSDNANKMGTDMSMIQNAYQGFAKANYTMLDNLKLGYGGTKEEMARLIADAAALSDTVDAQSMSFANIVEAIHVVQTEMGITGTTALEASTTISGSVSSMKAAWADFLTSLSDENADYQYQLDNLLESVKIVAGNVLPVVEQVLWSVTDAIEDILPDLIDKIPEFANEAIPKISEIAIMLVESLVNGINENQEMVSNIVFDVITYMADSFIPLLPKIADTGINIVKSLLNGMLQNQGDIVSGVLTTVNTLVDCIADNLPVILATGVMLIGQIAAGLIQGLPDLLYRIPEIIVEIWNAFADNADVFLEIGKSIVVGIWEGIKSLWSSLTENFSGLWKSLSMAQNYQITGQISPVNGSHANGLSYVPFDGYIAELHKGERVLTADEARGYNNRSNSGYDERPIKIVVQSVLDGKVIGETAYNYNRRKARAGGT